MPKYALLSELHANWEALVAVYKNVLSRREIREVCVLGDIVGYGPNPNEVITGLEEIESNGLVLHLNMGGHDAAALGDFQFVDLADPADLELVCREMGLASKKEIGHAFRHHELGRFIPVKPEAKAALEWTKERLTPYSREFLRRRLAARTELKPGVVCVHGSPVDPVFEYVHDERSVAKSFESPSMNGISICFVGHTHQPMVWTQRSQDRFQYAGKVVLLSKPTVSMPPSLKLELLSHCYLINVGAVGQPRDGDPRACFLVYDSDVEEVQYVRVPYDVERTKAKIREFGLPPVLARRLDQAT